MKSKALGPAGHRPSRGRSLDPPTRSVMQRLFAKEYNPGAAADLEHEANRMGQLAGQPARTFASAQRPTVTSFDFSGVRLHDDAASRRSAHTLGARAYTVGDTISVGKGGLDPELLAHELAHVVQQTSANQRMVQCKPLTYGNTAITIPIPTKPFTLQEAQNEVTAQQTASPPALTSGSVKGATPGSDAEIFLWHILAEVASPGVWGTEMDLIQPIGWATPTTPAPTGAVTVRIDDKGAGTAELVSTAAVAPPQTYPDIASAKTGLASTYGLSSVIDGDATWTLDELNRISGAFGLLPGPDKAAIKGVILKRVATIDPTHAARFESETAAVTATTTAASQTSTLEIGNDTFAAEKDLFVGGAGAVSPRSYQTIVHEVGHAVASKVNRDAALAKATAIVGENVLVDPLNKAVEALNASIADLNASITDFNAALKESQAAAASRDATRIAAANMDLAAKKATMDQKRKDEATLKRSEESSRAALTAAKRTAEAKTRAAESTLVPKSSVNAQKSRVAALGAAATRALATAKARPLTAQETTESDAYRSAVDDVAKNISDYAAAIAAGGADPDPLDSALDSALDARATERQNLTTASSTNPALTAFTPVEQAQDAWGVAVKTWARLADRTMRVQKFVDMVNANHIVPFTAYAKQNWPFNPDEFFAEAYSLWRTDPEYLKGNAKPVFEFFEHGSYR